MLLSVLVFVSVVVFVSVTESTADNSFERSCKEEANATSLLFPSKRNRLLAVKV